MELNLKTSGFLGIFVGFTRIYFQTYVFSFFFFASGGHEDLFANFWWFRAIFTPTLTIMLAF